MFLCYKPVKLIEVMEDDAVPSKDFTEAPMNGRDENFAALPRNKGLIRLY